jgi:putative efflux protein, MATE family
MVFLEKYKPDKAFLKMVWLIALPIVLQQTVENLVGLADSVMLSNYNSIGVSAVQVGSQWENISFLFSFGICSGVGIYLSQFFGANDYLNVKKSFGTMIILSLCFASIFVSLAVLIPEAICRFYIDDPMVIKQGANYLSITGISYFFTMISFCFTYSYRSIGKTKITMAISITQVISNVVLNYFLIYGYFGFPELGIIGAAIATLLARIIGCLTYVIFTFKTKQVFIGKFKEMFSLNKEFLYPVLKRITPTVTNEAFFGIGQTLFTKAFGYLGAAAITSVAIADRISSLFFMVVWAVVNSVQAIIGATLGKGDYETAKKYSNWFMGLGFVLSIFLGLGMIITSPILVNTLYTKELSTIKQAATAIMFAYALKIGLRFFNAIIFGFLRCGGDTGYLALLDSVVLYLVGIPLAFISVLVFNLNIVVIVVILQIEQVVRIILAFKRYKQGVWLKNVTTDIKN